MSFKCIYNLYLLMPVFQNVFDIAPVVLYGPACEVLDLEWKAVCVFYNFVIIKHITPFGDGGFLEILRPQLKLPCPFYLSTISPAIIRMASTISAICSFVIPSM